MSALSARPSQDAAVTPFRHTSSVAPRAATEDTVAPPDSSILFGEVLRGVTIVRDWPQRIAVLVGDRTHASAIASLQHLGFAPIFAPPRHASEIIREVSPFSFLLLSADVLADDDAIDRARAWHRCAPAARMSLLCTAEELSADVLVRAIRAGVTDVLDPQDVHGFEATLRTSVAQAGATRERVLAIGAHPDDVEIGCGGTLLDHRRRGDRVTILTLSRGAVGGDREARLLEADTTAEAIGAQLLMADLADTEIDDGIDTIRLIESVVRAVDPSVVYVHSANDNHQDHRAVHTAARSATRGVRRVFTYQSPSATNSFLPTQFVSVDEVIERKVEVLQMFDSQGGRSYLEPELVKAQARYWARHLTASARYAEPFEVIRSVGELRHAATAPDLSLAMPSPRPVRSPAMVSVNP